MKKYINVFLMIMSSIILFQYCSNNNDEILSANYELPESNEIVSGYLNIYTEKDKYSLEEVKFENMIYIHSSLKNLTGDTLYTKLGDNFISNLDQPDLFMAYGSDGYLENYTNHKTWKDIKLAMKVEGNGLIRILPFQEYNLSAVLYDTTEIEGVFKLKVNYSKSKNPSFSDTLVDISNCFIISK